jgi:hypothetical protein
LCESTIISTLYFYSEREEENNRLSITFRPHLHTASAKLSNEQRAVSLRCAKKIAVLIKASQQPREQVAKCSKKHLLGQCVAGAFC